LLESCASQSEDTLTGSAGPAEEQLRTKPDVRAESSGLLGVTASDSTPSLSALHASFLKRRAGWPKEVRA